MKTLELRTRAEWREWLAASHQKEYLAWIGTAKRTETREKRIAESISLLVVGKKLGLR